MKILSLRKFGKLIPILVVLYLSSFLGEYLTFFLFDLILSVYLFGLFKNKWRILFLLHPFIVFISSLGFEVNFEEIGVGWTYINTFNDFMSPSDYQDSKKSFFEVGWNSTYIGVLPFLWLPNAIFSNELSPLTYFYSMSIWNLCCGIITVKIARALNSISNRYLFLLVLFFVMSPMSLEINNSIHRYHVLILGFLLFFFAWIKFRRGKENHGSLVYLVILFAITIIAFSKFALLISLLIFVIADLSLRKNIRMLEEVSIVTIYISVAVILLIIYLLGFQILPERYLVSDFNKGPINTFTQAPVIGYFTRVLFSILAPFPFLEFNQWDLYGDNEIFLITHLFSCVITLWFFLSLYLNLKELLLLNDVSRMSVLMILAITFSLSFSAVGHNVYLSPAIPFLSMFLMQRKYLCNISYPIVIILFAEMVLYIT